MVLHDVFLLPVARLPKKELFFKLELMVEIIKLR